MSIAFSNSVIPAKAGIPLYASDPEEDSRFRGNDAVFGTDAYGRSAL